MNNNFNAETRQNILDNLTSTTYDLIIIGGGVTGAGVLRDAAMRGLKVLLLERGDFASGTSSRSSKLLHGGLRYLAKFKFGLTMESLKERDNLYRENKHLVDPMPFLFPIYKDDKNGPLMIRIGLYLYTMLAAGALPWPHMLDIKESKEKAPMLREEGFQKAGYYYDTKVDDARLTVLTIVSGIENGGHAVNYAPVIGFEKTGGKITAVKIEDIPGNKEYTARASAFINATGVDVDNIRSLDSTISQSRLMPTKGIHIVIPADKIPINCTVAFNSVDDNRPLFIIPWDDVSLVGTTDTYEKHDIHTPPILESDVNYLLRSLNHYFPKAGVENSDIVSMFSGVRPLVLPEGYEPGENASDISREDAIYEDESGLISMAGGKLTTYRHMAERLVNKAIERLPDKTVSRIKPCSSQSIIIKGSENPDRIKGELIREFDLDEKTAAHLVKSYGSKAKAIAIMGKDKNELVPMINGMEYVLAEARYCARFEQPLHLTDMLSRRIRLAIWKAGKGLDVADKVSEIMADELKWDDKTRKNEIRHYQDFISREHSVSTG